MKDLLRKINGLTPQEALEHLNSYDNFNCTPDEESGDLNDPYTERLLTLFDEINEMQNTVNARMRVLHANSINKNPVYHDVKSINDAIIIINAIAQEELLNEDIEFNAFGLEVYEDDDWSEYYDEEGRDISEIMSCLNDSEV